MTARPVVSVYSKDSTDVVGQLAMPAVFTAPIRDDIVQFVHSNIAKNRIQAHGVHWMAGKMHSAESWGTGRAVARIPRISGSGTHRSGQAAFGNMCRKGHMFAPLKIYRRWHRKTNVNQNRHAVAAALAAAACAPLVLARGHRVEGVPELPLVVDSLNVDSTKALLQSLQNAGATADLHRARHDKHRRAGTGKYRNSRFILRKGPLIVYGDANENVKRTARNLPGVDVCHVSRLNLLQLAPGGHIGRFVVFTKDAFASLDNIFGTYREKGIQKSGYQLARNEMNVADLARIINSDQVQSKLRDVRSNTQLHHNQKKNPLKNRALMQRLNPASKTLRAAEEKATKDRQAARKAALKAKRSKSGRKEKQARAATFRQAEADLKASYDAAHALIVAQDEAGRYVNPDEQ
jgi:large subunit ribosomal protein L4e